MWLLPPNPGPLATLDEWLVWRAELLALGPAEAGVHAELQVADGFIAELQQAAQATSVPSTAKPGRLSFEADLARMQSPLFKRMARELERTVPEDAGFGRFRDKPQSGL